MTATSGSFAGDWRRSNHAENLTQKPVASPPRAPVITGPLLQYHDD